jgi:4'-phosphopantetheinyl transferase
VRPTEAAGRALDTRPVLAAAGAELWLVDLDAAAGALRDSEAAVARLSPDDVERIERIASADAREERRLTHIALRLILERACGAGARGIDFARSSTGRPSLPGWDGAFSLSHAAGFALIAIAARGRIGVDLERGREVTFSSARRAEIVAAAEALAPDAPLPDEPDLRIIQAWVRLEAVAKAEGAGIGAVLERLGVGRGRGERVDVATQLSGSELAVHDIAVGLGLRAAAAHDAGFPFPRLEDFPILGAEIAALLV